MKAYSRWMPVIASLLALAMPAAAQQAKGGEAKPPEPKAEAKGQEAAPEADEGKHGWFFAEISDWISQPSGLEYTPATAADLQDPYGTRVLDVGNSTENRFRYRVGYVLNHNLGEFILTWWSHDTRAALNQYAPGSFVFGESAVVPYHAGVFDNGLADAFESTTRTKLRDLRIDYVRVAFSSPRITGKWFVGYRHVQHQRGLDVAYFALDPNLPPIPANKEATLAPLADVAAVQSDFSGRGAEAGLDLALPIKGKVWVETGLALAILRGKTTTAYRSLTHYYLLTPPQGNPTVIAPPYDEFSQRLDPNDPASSPLVDFIQQVDAPVGLNAVSESVNAQVLETYLGFRWRAWRDLEAFAGFRNARYTNVGMDLRPKTVAPSSNGVLNFQDVTRIDHSVSYEGYYVGVSYRY